MQRPADGEHQRPACPGRPLVRFAGFYGARTHDVVASPDRVVVNVNVPGIKPEEIKVEVEDDQLTISGEHTEEKEEKGERYVRRERRHGSFSRTIALPDTAKRDEVDATCHDGVLSVTVPLAEVPKREARTITPKAA